MKIIGALFALAILVLLAGCVHTNNAQVSPDNHFLQPVTTKP
ncbi:MAG: hypothetical protein WDN00_16975 [Limisphaerales bacterium]